MAALALTTVKERLGHLNVDEAVETVKTLGRGSYGVVVEMRVRGLRSVPSVLSLSTCVAGFSSAPCPTSCCVISLTTS